MKKIIIKITLALFLFTIGIWVANACTTYWPNDGYNAHLEVKRQIYCSGVFSEKYWRQPFSSYEDVVCYDWFMIYEQRMRMADERSKLNNYY